MKRPNLKATIAYEREHYQERADKWYESTKRWDREHGIFAELLILIIPTIILSPCWFGVIYIIDIVEVLK